MPVELNIIESVTELDTTVVTVVLESASEPGPAGPGVPTGGTAGQVLTKDSGTDYDTSWQDSSGGPGGGGAAEDVTFDPAGTISATDVQAAVEEVASDATTALATHESDTTNVHGITDTAALALTANVPSNSTFNDHSARHENGGADEINIGGLDGTSTELAAHLADSSDAHDASAISVVSTTLSGTGTDVQAVFEEIDNLLDDHSSRHENGGADEIDLTGLSGIPADAQPLDSDLTAIAALTTTSFGRGLLELANAAALLAAAGAQASDSDLTAIAGLSPSNDDIVQRKSGAWANRTLAQLMTDLAALGTTFQPLDSDLTSIAALTTTSYGRGLLALSEFNAVLPYIKLSHTVSANTQGGASSSGSWQTRVINTEDTDTGSHCSLSSNQFTLSAGTYQCRGWTTIAGSAQAKVRIRNATGGTTLLVGNNEYAPGGAGVGTVCPVVVGQFTVAASQALELQYRVTNARATDGLGVAANWTENEVYAVVELWKVA